MPLQKRKRGRPPKAKSHATITKTKKGPNKSTKTFVCDECTTTYPTKEALARHLRVCLERKNQVPIELSVVKSKYKCSKCNKKFRFKKSYDQHLENDHATGPGSVACTQCTVSCPDEETLKTHIANFHEREIFKCEHCDKTFVRRSHVLRHMSQKGCDGNQISLYPCEICEATFTRKDNLMVHLRLQHIAVNAYKCKLCPYHTKNFSKIIKHNLRTHSDTPNEYICDYCGKITSSRAAIAKHLEIHGEKKYECNVCGYNTFTIEVMRRHVLTHVAEKPHKCDLCGRSYIQRLQLQRHMEKHASNTCNECGSTFKTKAKLIMHSREHLGLNKLVCPIENCPCVKKEFVNESSLHNHIVKIHVEDKSFSCGVCPKRFHSEANARRHVATHTLERPRRCMYCVAARAYVRGEQLVRHVRKHHPAVFKDHLAHVRQVLGSNLGMDRVKKSELESILNVLDAESERILEGYGFGVLYGGMQEKEDDDTGSASEVPIKVEASPLLSGDELAESLNKLLEQLIDKDILESFGWPNETVDVVLEKVIEHCGARAADREKWNRVQRLRENAKHLFLYVVEDKNVARMLHTHTIDQIVKHILAQTAAGDA